MEEIEIDNKGKDDNMTSMAISKYYFIIRYNILKSN